MPGLIGTQVAFVITHIRRFRLVAVILPIYNYSAFLRLNADTTSISSISNFNVCVHVSLRQNDHFYPIICIADLSALCFIIYLTQGYKHFHFVLYRSLLQLLSRV